MTNIEIRTVDVRSINEETRTIRGIAVPYGQDTEIGGYTERFEKGAFEDTGDVKLFWSHREPIGKVIAVRDTDEGYEVEARISETNLGSEAYTLLKDGVVDKFSVGFEPIEHRMDEGVVVRTKARLREVSIVPFPAYAGASISEIRAAVEEDSEVRMTSANKEKEDMDMSNENRETEVADLRGAVEDLGRQIEILKAGAGDEVSGSQFRSGGDFLKALSRGDDTAKMEIRDFATSTEADNVRPTWMNEALKLVQENRPLINTFSKGVLPATGNSIEYPFVKTTTGTVGQQVNEGDDLSYMEVAVDTATAPVRTYGGYSSLSRQAIERSDVAYLDAVLRYQAQQYAKATEAAVAATLSGATGTNTVEMANGSTGSAAAWLEAVSDAAYAIENNSLGLRADVLLVDRDTFKQIVLIEDNAGRPVFALNGDGRNTFGNANVLGQSAVVGGMQVVVVPGVVGSVMVSKEALRTLESSGAPVRLADENIINLTKDFSLYGYLATYVKDAKGITKITEAAA